MMARMFRDWGIALGLAAVLLVGLRVFPLMYEPPLGEAKDFSLPSLTGAPITLSELDNDVVVLNFWFTSCPPCRKEIPELSAFQRENPDIALIGVSTDIGMPLGTLAVLSERLGVDYPVAHDARAITAERYGVSTFPTTLILRDMDVVDAHVGVLDRRRLETMIKATEGS